MWETPSETYAASVISEVLREERRYQNVGGGKSSLCPLCLSSTGSFEGQFMAAGIARRLLGGGKRASEEEERDQGSCEQSRS